jgi:hypothetical protein
MPSFCSMQIGKIKISADPLKILIMMHEYAILSYVSHASYASASFDAQDSHDRIIQTIAFKITMKHRIPSNLIDC